MPSFEFNFNHIYEPVFTSDCRYKDIVGGRGRGGSHFGTDYFLFLITQPVYFRGYFVRNVFNDIKDSLFQDIKDRIADNDTINIEDFHINESIYSLIYKPTGNKIISKGIVGSNARTAKMKSLAGATHVLIEEADELSEDDFDQLDLSIRTTKSERVEILRIFNPPHKNHWIWRDYHLTDKNYNVNDKVHTYYSYEPKSESNVLCIYSTYKDNIDNLQESTMLKFESFKQDNPDYFFNQIQGLIPQGVRGKIFSGWEKISIKDYELLDLPKVYAIDFGFSSDPTAILEIKYHNDYRYYRELLYLTGLTNIDLAIKLNNLGISETDIIVADYGAGGDMRIAELRRGVTCSFEDNIALSYNIHPTIKGPDSIIAGIDKVKACKVFMTEDSSNGWFEYQEYKWALDKNKEPTTHPIDKYNHLMDCVRYFELNKGRLY